MQSLVRYADMRHALSRLPDTFSAIASPVIAIAVFLLICHGARAQTIDSTDRFVFHSDFWINLNHYLFQQADSSQLKHLHEDGNALIDLGEVGVIKSMSPADRATLLAAVHFYRTQMRDRALGSDLRLWLQAQEGRQIADTAQGAILTTMFNAVAPVYERHLWPLHDTQNRNTLKLHLKRIRAFEPTVVEEMARMSGAPWPDVKVRVDLTAYANYAGAYTVVRPAMNVLISTLDPGSTDASFIETVFHEGSHLLFSRSSPFRSRIYFKSEEMGVPFPNGLWHAAQFYLCGRVIQDLLEPMGIDYEMQLYSRNIYPEYDLPGVADALEEYYRGAEMEDVIEAMIKALDQS